MVTQYMIEPTERRQMQYEIGAYLHTRIADASNLACTVWADGILGIIEEHIGEQ